MRKIYGYMILIASITIVLTSFITGESIVGKLIPFIVGVGGIFDGLKLIQNDKV